MCYFLLFCFVVRLFIEQPIGVGYSFSDNSKDYNVGDNQAVEDMYSMILGFLQEYDDFKNNDFYIASESYGGHYMPMLASYIVQHNTNNEINFKGFLVGNPLTDMVENAKGMYDTFYGHSLVSYPLWSTWHVQCDDGNNQSTYCQDLMSAMNQQVEHICIAHCLLFLFCFVLFLFFLFSQYCVVFFLACFFAKLIFFLFFSYFLFFLVYL